MGFNCFFLWSLFGLSASTLHPSLSYPPMGLCILGLQVVYSSSSSPPAWLSSHIPSYPPPTIVRYSPHFCGPLAHWVTHILQSGFLSPVPEQSQGLGSWSRPWPTWPGHSQSSSWTGFQLGPPGCLGSIPAGTWPMAQCQSSWWI